jgi:hypothetical protein
LKRIVGEIPTKNPRDVNVPVKAQWRKRTQRSGFSSGDGPLAGDGTYKPFKTKEFFEDPPLP